ncbi:MAG: type II toxin-antitoxin system RelE/ParE family toxin [Verrucomicrobiae bacterium]|nr:type II toxin-antitoxin system RelE/ParE family toxin [Verrucomicrobiae bacterium]
MGQVIAHSEAIAELREAIRYYEEKSPGLGRRFLDEVNEFVLRIVEHPTRHSERVAGVRRANLKRFPLHIHYLLDADTIAIVAIAHDKRRPFYWKERLGGEVTPSSWSPYSGDAGK